MLKNNKFKVKLVFLQVISFSENCYTELVSSSRIFTGWRCVVVFFCKFYFVYLISLNVQGDATLRSPNELCDPHVLWDGTFLLSVSNKTISTHTMTLE